MIQSINFVWSTSIQAEQERDANKMKRRRSQQPQQQPIHAVRENIKISSRHCKTGDLLLKTMWSRH